MLGYIMHQVVNMGLICSVVNFIHRSYIDLLAEEINDKLQENGTVTIAELAKTYDLPGDFIKQVCVNSSKL
jgi:E3 UFM1-protein ligase 1